jgi:hypothetical protein
MLCQKAYVSKTLSMNIPYIRLWVKFLCEGSFAATFIKPLCAYAYLYLCPQSERIFISGSAKGENRGKTTGPMRTSGRRKRNKNGYPSIENEEYRQCRTPAEPAALPE